MQAVLSDCNGNSETFDDSTNSGIEVINSYDTAAPTSGGPKITTGGVTLCQAGQGNQLCASTPTCDPYFSVVPNSSCSVNLTANVTFSPDVTNGASVTATDTSTSVTRTLRASGTGTVWTTQQPFSIGDATGQHLFQIDWSQKSGSVGGVTCTNQNPCSGTFGIQQQGFGSCNGCDQPDDSGPIVKSQIRLNTDPAGTTGENAFQQGSTQQLVVTLQLAGIRAQPANGTPAPDTILRFSGSTNHQTGLVDCGQGSGPGGSGTVADAYTIFGGCGPSNPFEPPQCSNNGATCKLPVLNPLYVYGRSPVPADQCYPHVDQDYTDWPSGNHQDCVETTPGTRRIGIVCGLVQRITGVTPAAFAASGGACNSNNGGTCPANNWTNPNGIPDGDPREVDVVLTAPIDLAAADGSPQAWVPIRKFAKFYVTGWDPSVSPSCTNVNDSFPGPPGGKQTQNGAIWGHWMSDTENGTGDGNPCPLNSIEPAICVPVLTR
jgi:hypothetical protein